MALRRFAAVLLVGALAALSGCTTAVDGTGTIGLHVIGDSHSAFDSQAKTAISAVLSYWNATYPVIDHGHRLPQLRGKLYSVDGAAVVRHKVAPPVARTEKCLQEQVGFIIDNAAYCELDDSIVWDRSPQSPAAGARRAAYGPARHRAGVRPRVRSRRSRSGCSITDEHTRRSTLESQADCAAGAFVGRGAGRPGAALPADPGRTRPGAGRLPADPRLDAGLAAGHLARRRLRPAQRAAARASDPARPTASGRPSSPIAPSPSAVTSATTTTSTGGNQPLADVLDPTGGWSPTSTASGRAAGEERARRSRRCTIAEAEHPACGARQLGQRVRLLPRRQHRLLQRGIRARRRTTASPCSIIRPSTGDVQLRPQPAGRLRARHAVRDRLGHGRAAPVLHDASTTDGDRADRGDLLRRRLRRGHQPSPTRRTAPVRAVPAGHGRGDLGGARAWSGSTGRSARAGRPACSGVTGRSSPATTSGLRRLLTHTGRRRARRLRRYARLRPGLPRLPARELAGAALDTGRTSSAPSTPTSASNASAPPGSALRDARLDSTARQRGRRAGRARRARRRLGLRQRHRPHRRRCRRSWPSRPSPPRRSAGC